MHETREYSIVFMAFYSSERRFMDIGWMSECHSFLEDHPGDAKR